ncbi:allatostatin-A receptor-like [Asterias rubens]|uniref:allatostatin-A receptor-like n=1 Tax=Asterias rubens TaxID=7604 RepID=UPI0014558661|nr:allatostatin-A receptor-like [Asterias rubens]
MGSSTSLLVINTASGVLGILGNGLVSLVIIFERSMHTNTNALILHQATIDFLGSVFILLQAYIPQVLQPLPGGAPGVLLCYFWNSRYFQLTFFVASTYSLIAVTFERYFAIVHPFRYERYFNNRRAIVLTIAGSWFVVLSIRSYVFVQWSVVDGDTCHQSGIGAYVGVVIFLMQYAIPLALMSYMYFRIAWELSKSAKRVVPTVSDRDPHNRNRGGESLLRARRNTFKALLIVFFTFVICWSLNQILFLRHNAGLQRIDFSSNVYIISVGLIATNACINPFIYAIKYKKFKSALRRLFYRVTRQEDRMNYSDDYPNTERTPNTH